MLERSHQDGLGYNRVIFIISQLTKKTSTWVWFVDSCGGPCICSTRRPAAVSSQTDTFTAMSRLHKIFQIRLEIFVLYTAETNITRPAVAVMFQHDCLDQWNVILEVQADPTAIRRQKTSIICCNCNRPVRSWRRKYKKRKLLTLL